jgi:hypothetical protein
MQTARVNYQGNSEELGFKVEPYLYSVRTRTFGNVSNLPKDLRILTQLKKKKVYTKTMQLTEEQKKLFKRYGVKFELLTYKVSDPVAESQQRA